MIQRIPFPTAWMSEYVTGAARERILQLFQKVAMMGVDLSTVAFLVMTENSAGEQVLPSSSRPLKYSFYEDGVLIALLPMSLPDHLQTRLPFFSYLKELPNVPDMKIAVVRGDEAFVGYIEENFGVPMVMQLEPGAENKHPAVEVVNKVLEESLPLFRGSILEDSFKSGVEIEDMVYLAILRPTMDSEAEVVSVGALDALKEPPVLDVRVLKRQSLVADLPSQLASMAADLAKPAVEGSFRVIFQGLGILLLRNILIATPEADAARS